MPSTSRHLNHDRWLAVVPEGIKKLRHLQSLPLSDQDLLRKSSGIWVSIRDYFADNSGAALPPGLWGNIEASGLVLIILDWMELAVCEDIAVLRSAFV